MVASSQVKQRSAKLWMERQASSISPPSPEYLSSTIVRNQQYTPRTTPIQLYHVAKSGQINQPCAQERLCPNSEPHSRFLSCLSRLAITAALLGLFVVRDVLKTSSKHRFSLMKYEIMSNQTRKQQTPPHSQGPCKRQFNPFVLLRQLKRFRTWSTKSEGRESVWFASWTGGWRTRCHYTWLLADGHFRKSLGTDL